MSQRVKRAERKRRQREHAAQDATCVYCKTWLGDGRGIRVHFLGLLFAACSEAHFDRYCASDATTAEGPALGEFTPEVTGPPLQFGTE